MRELMTVAVGIQLGFNTVTNGPDWLTGTTKEGLNIDWDACLTAEIGELMDSLPYKHWKDINSKGDLQNARMELADILAFSISRSAEVVNNSFNNDVPNSTLIDIVTNSVVVAVSMGVMIPRVNDSKKELINSVKQMNNNLNNKDHRQIYIDLNTTCDRLITYDNPMSTFTFKDLTKLYLGKMILNTFRQENGYKDGSYIKIWNGKEDNVALMSIIDNITCKDVDWSDTVKNELTKAYAEVI